MDVWMKTVEVVLKYPAPYMVLKKTSTCHKIFHFWQMAKNNILYSPK